MANRDSSSIDPAIATACVPLHVPFSWHGNNTDGDPIARFISQVRNVVRGGATVANIIRKDGIRDDSGQPRLLTNDDRDGLVGLMIAAFEMMDEEAETHLDRLEKLAEKGAKK